MPSKRTKSKASRTSELSRHKANSIPKADPAFRPSQSYVVIDTTLPSHVINDHSLFTTYTPGHNIYRTALGHDIIIEGTGDVEVRVFAAGQYICFRMRNCWHVPSSSHHFLSCTTTTSSGHQVMITARTPRILFPNSRRLAEPRLPKYVPLTKVDGCWVLKFEIPAQGPISSQLPSTAVQTAAQATTSLHTSMHQLKPFAALSHLPPFSFAPVDFQSAAMISMVSQYNALLDLRSTYHIVRDRRLFCSFAEKSISVDTANCGSLEALGIGDVEFRCPFRDRHVVFTLRGCLYAPDAPINLLSVGTLVERGLSCVFTSGGLTKVFYPQNHAKLPGFTFSAFVTNRLSFLKLVFLPPVDSASPKYIPFEQASSSSSLLFAGLTFNHNLPPTPSSRQHHQHAADVVSNTNAVQVVTNVCVCASDSVEAAGPGLRKCTDVVLSMSEDVALPAHGGVMMMEDRAVSFKLSLNSDFFQVASDAVGVTGTHKHAVEIDIMCWSDTNGRIHVGNDFILHSFALFPLTLSSLPSPLTSNSIMRLLYDYSLSFSCDNFPSHFSLESPLPSFFSILSKLNPFLPFVSLHFKFSSLSTIIFSCRCCPATPSLLNSASLQCHGVTFRLNASSRGTTLLPSPFQTNPRIPYKLPVPGIVPLARSHIAMVLSTYWSPDPPHNDTGQVVPSGRVDGKATIWNAAGEDVGSAVSEYLSSFAFASCTMTFFVFCTFLSFLFFLLYPSFLYLLLYDICSFFSFSGLLFLFLGSFSPFLHLIQHSSFGGLGFTLHWQLTYFSLYGGASVFMGIGNGASAGSSPTSASPLLFALIATDPTSPSLTQVSNNPSSSVP